VVGVALVALVVASGVLRSRGRRVRWMPWLTWPKARWVFWPRVPRYGAEDEKLSGLWARVAGFIGRRSRMSWVLTTLVLLAGSFFATTLKADGLSIADSFTTSQESVTGQQILGTHFPAGSGNPAVIIAKADKAAEVVAAAQAVPGIDQVVPYTGAAPGDTTAQPKVVDGLVMLDAVLSSPSDSPQAQQTVRDLRDAVHAVPGADAKVGGFTAINYDTQQSSQRDRTVIIPIVLVVILLILMLLLRAVVGPVLLVLTVVLSFTATMGVCALFFNHVFHFAGADSSFPLFAFVFLVALGVDYNIFLTTRVREETVALGTRRGILKGLTVTGGVITSAGVVLAATFSVLGTLPLVFLAELGFAVAFGVLLDTLVVRTFLVPALWYDVGRPVWWPSRLARVAEPAVSAGRDDGGAAADVREPVG
jgi:putative drug exporter of the RND superfamily